jgi:hypothetical protein
LRCPARVSNHLAHGLLPSFETPREVRAAPQDEVGIHSQTRLRTWNLEIPRCAIAHLMLALTRTPE